MTLLLLVGAAVFMVIFFGINQLLGVTMPAFGLLFLVYWAAILKQDLGAFFPAFCGGMTGLALAWVLFAVMPRAGVGSLPLSLGLVAVVLFCFMRGHATLVVNNATMLFLTVATIPQIDVARNAPMLAASLLIGAAYMGLTTVAMQAIARRRAAGGRL